MHRVDRRIPRFALIAALVALPCSLPSTSLVAEEAPEQTKSPEKTVSVAAVKKLHAKLMSVLEAYNVARKKAAENPKAAKILSKSESAVFGARNRFLEAFLNSDWDAWDAVADRQVFQTALWKSGTLLLHSTPELSQRAFETILEKYPGSGELQSRAREWLPYTVQAQDDIEGALRKSREFFDEVEGATLARMKLFAGDLMTALGHTDLARESYLECLKIARPLNDGFDKSVARTIDDAMIRVTLIGSPPPELDSPDWVGKGGTSFSSLKGKVVLAKFGNTCMSCRRGFALAADVYDARSDQNFAAVGVMTPEDKVFLPASRSDLHRGVWHYGVDRKKFPKMVKELRKRLDARYPIAVVKRQQLRRYGLQGVELTMVIDEEGIVRFVDVSGKGMGLANRLLEHLLGVREITSRGKPLPVLVIEDTPLEFGPLPLGPRPNADLVAKRAEFDSAKDSPDAALAYGRALEQRRRFQDAADALEAAIASAPRHAELLYLMAKQKLVLAELILRDPKKLGLRESHIADAGAWIRRAAAANEGGLKPKLLEARWVLANSAIDPGHALKILEGLAKEHPDNFDVNYALGVHWTRLASIFVDEKPKWVSAEKWLARAHALNPAHAGVICDWTFAREKLRTTESEFPSRERTNEYRRGVSLDPDVRFAFYEHSLAAEPSEQRPVDRMLQLKESMASGKLAIDDMLQKHPDHPELIRAMASTILEEKRTMAEAMERFEVARKARPTDPHLAIAHGKYLISGDEKDRESGVAALVMAVRLCQRVLDRRIYDQVDYISVRDPHLTAEQRNLLWRVLLQEFPAEINAPTNAEVYCRDVLGFQEGSLIWCMRALKIDPDDPMIHNDLGVLYEEEGRFHDKARAEEQYVAAIMGARKKGIDHQSKSLGYLNAVDNLSKLLLSQGDDGKTRLLRFAEEHLQDDERFDSIVERARDE